MIHINWSLEALIIILNSWIQLYPPPFHHRYHSRAQFDDLQTVSLTRLSELKESLLTLGQFEEAYDELRDWLAKTHHQLQNPDLITGEGEQVTALLAKHKVWVLVIWD